MSVSSVAEAINTVRPDVVSTDLFDTILLRDGSVEADRLEMACRRAAPLLGVHAAALTRLRWDFHQSAYRAVAIERPDGDASLASICRAIATALGLDLAAAELLHDTEVGVDIEHLRANHALVAVLDAAARRGVRVIAVSDTYYDEADLNRMLDEVVGVHPISRVYSSSQLGFTKQAGRVFEKVMHLENVDASRVVHVGDNIVADVNMPRAAHLTAVHLPRDAWHRASKWVGKVQALPIQRRRIR